MIWRVLLYLSELPGNTDGPTEAIASNEQGLHTPAPEMAECKNVKMAQNSLPSDDVTVHGIFLKRATKIILMTDNLPAHESSGTRATPLTMMSASLLA